MHFHMTANRHFTNCDNYRTIVPSLSVSSVCDAVSLTNRSILSTSHTSLGLRHICIINDPRMWTGQSPLADSCEHGNEPVVSIISGQFPKHLSDHQLPKKNLLMMLENKVMRGMSEPKGKEGIWEWGQFRRNLVSPTSDLKTEAVHSS
jgi:hypothetical protein